MQVFDDLGFEKTSWNKMEFYYNFDMNDILINQLFDYDEILFKSNPNVHNLTIL